ncbi:penicillin-binding protein 2 [Allostreptomyces psammosilenae]|uniref:Penicillin-binding protein 2 n=1 Tax=Allostreptomyces psammosilenae TaxID=1892865 RepID=A0A853A871_9ACTN|nr:penicillin-binding protein 2 [Allostreptomyces psammosilenae]NYI06632.1 penicillin-binding protein 2 [Allostreptomyces psammosilenae]
MTNIPATGSTPRVTTRLVILQVIVVSLLATLGGRLWYLQIRNGEEYSTQAVGQHVREIVTPAVRGQILDANGLPLADNRTALVVSVDRTELSQQEDGGDAVLDRLADVLGMDPQDVRNRIRLCDAQTPQPCWNGSPYQPVPVTDEATTQQALQIMERREDFPGIIAEPTAVRRYPAPEGANAAQVLGYLSPVTDEELQESEAEGGTLQRADQIGRMGLERSYDDVLRGTDGIESLEVDNLGRVMGTASTTPAVPGQHLVTSIDARIQAIAEEQLMDALERARSQVDTGNTGRRFEGDSGAVVVMDTRTGRIIAMASAPTYDPNVWTGGISSRDYEALTSEEANVPLLNRATQGLAPPGSVFKVVSTAASIEAGYDRDGTYPCPASMNIGGQTFRNHETSDRGSITFAEALMYSCDTVYYQLAYEMWLADGGTDPVDDPADPMHTMAQEFGLGSLTGIDIPEESAGRVPTREWKQEFWEANRDTWCEQAENPDEDEDPYIVRLNRENCLEGNVFRAGDTVNFSIGQGDLQVTPLQIATIYAAIANGGTLWQPSVGKATVTADGTRATEIQPQANGELPVDDSIIDYLDEGLRRTAMEGTAGGVFAGWPHEEIPVGAKTGTAEVAGSQARSWFASYTEDYAIVMTVSQGGSGSGTSGPSVRKIYDALYGVQPDGSIDTARAMLPAPQDQLPTVNDDGTIDPLATSGSYTDPEDVEQDADADGSGRGTEAAGEAEQGIVEPAAWSPAGGRPLGDGGPATAAAAAVVPADGAAAPAAPAPAADRPEETRRRYDLALLAQVPPGRTT